VLNTQFAASGAVAGRLAVAGLGHMVLFDFEELARSAAGPIPVSALLEQEGIYL